MDDEVELIAPEDFVSGFFETACNVLRRDGAHAIIVLSFNEGEIVDALKMDSEEKDQTIKGIADSMTSRPIDALILMAEFWSAPVAAANSGLRPSQSDQRFETLEVWGAFRDAPNIAISAPIIRNGESGLELGESIISHEAQFHLLDPVLANWRSANESSIH